MTDDPRAFIAGIFDRAAPTYDHVGVDYFQPIACTLVEDAGLTAGDRVLDVACGRGAVLFAAAETVGPTGHVTGLDLSPAMVQATAAEIRGRGLTNAEVVVMDAQQPSLDAASYDAILASLALFFLTDPAAALTIYREALREGGRLAFTTFGDEDARWSWREEMRRTFLPEQQLKPPALDTFETAESITALLHLAGFADVRSHLRVHEVRFADAEQWWRWTWSQGERAFWEQLDDEQTADAKEWCFQRISAFAAPDGSVPLSQPVRYTVARRP